MRYLLLLIPILINFHVYAEIQGEDNRIYAPRDYSIATPAPTVSQFLDFKDFPIDYFHGIPQISYTLYTLKCGAIEVPINLVYKGGGIRAQQKEGNAGLGWSLMFSAQIGHTVYGAPDDARQKMLGLWHLTDNDRLFRDKLILKDDSYDPTDAVGYNAYRNWQVYLGEEYSDGKRDLANDLYNLYGLGLSATFASPAHNKFVVSSESPIEIKESTDCYMAYDYNGCDHRSYVVKDLQGLTYKFQTQDRASFEYSYGSHFLEQTKDSLYYASCWHLDTISDLSGNRVAFTYSKRKSEFQETCGSVVYRKFINPELSYIMPDRCSGGSTVKHHSVVPVKIEGNGVQIDIEYMAESLDAKLVPIIQKIRVKAPDGAVKELSFEYENKTYYFLKSVKEAGQILLDFDYNIDSSELEYTLCQDFGGYRNNASIEGLIPSVGTIGCGGERHVDEESALNGTLKSITYPTGGSTTFEWESNRFKKIGSFPFEHGYSSENPVVIRETRQLRACLDEDYQNLKIEDWILGDGNFFSLDLSKYFLMNPANLYGTDYEHEHENDISKYSIHNPHNYPHILISKGDDISSDKRPVKVIWLDKKTIEDNPSGCVVNFGKGYYTFELRYPFSVQNSYDFLEANMRYGDSPAGRINIEYARYAESVTDTQNHLWPGLRIKRIISDSGLKGDSLIYKNFHYSIDMNPQAEDGVVQNYPEFQYNYYCRFPDLKVPGYNSSEIVCIGSASFPNTPVGTYNNIEYPYVRTYLSQSDEQHPTWLRELQEHYIYDTSEDCYGRDYNRTAFLSSQPVGGRMFTSKAHMRGNLLRKRIGSQTAAIGYGGSYVDKSYGYNIFEAENLDTLTTDAFPVCDFTRALGIVPSAGFDYSIGIYNIIPYNKTIAWEKSEDSHGLMSLKRYAYFYDSYTEELDFNLVKADSILDSEGRDIITRYFYCKRNKWMNPNAEVIVRYCGDRLISAERVQYNRETGLPEKKFELNRNASISLAKLKGNAKEAPSEIKNAIARETYAYKYDAMGNIVEISYKGRPLVSYIWGYNGLYPIIEAKNISHADLIDHAATIVGYDKLNGSRLQTQNEINAFAERLRAAFPSNEIASMAYHWLLGLMEYKDASGLSTFYSYDARGRLTGHSDFNGHLIKKYEYHYAKVTQ